MDQNGLKLDLMESADTFGISAPVVAGNAFSEAIGFGAEGFWWGADASIDNGVQTGILVMALEAAFSGGEIPTNGEQSAFGRIRVRVDGLTIGETYTVTHPFGTITAVATDSDGNGPGLVGDINETSDIGGFGVPGFPANFNIPLSSGIGPFLTWDTFNANPLLQDPLLVNPARPGRVYIGNVNIPHTVTGGTNGNAFTVTGLGLAGFTTNQFTVTGRVTQTVLAEVTPVPIFTNVTTPAYTFNAADAGTLTFGGDCASLTTTATAGDNTITFNALALGAHSNCTITLVTAGGSTDTLTVSPFTVSTVLPDTIGVQRSNSFFLRNTNVSGVADVSTAFGRPTDTPLTGDWDGNGTETIGLKRGNTYFLSNSNATPAADIVLTFGRATDMPIVGDWDGNGTDTIGLQRGNAYFLSTSNVTPGVGIISIASFGRATDTAVAGDWNGDDTDTIGLKRGNAYFLANSNVTPTTGLVSIASFGRATDTPLAGDWDGDGTDTVSLRRGATCFLNNSNVTPAVASTFTFGRATDMPVTGLYDLVP
jgi:hypothetical protein